MFLSNQRRKMYKVYDTLGQFLAAFPTFKAAMEYKSCMGRYDWTIKSPEPQKSNRPSTERQQKAVRWCEMVIGGMSGRDFRFNGDIASFKDCSSFLNKYLEECKAFMRELYCEYTADRGY